MGQLTHRVMRNGGHGSTPRANLLTQRTGRETGPRPFPSCPVTTGSQGRGEWQI